jgi:cell division protein ZipA
MIKFHNHRGLLTSLTVLSAVVGALAMGCSSSGSDDDRARVRVGGEELYLAPASASQARVRSILPAKGSEDVSNLLGPITSQTERSTSGGERDYRLKMAWDFIDPTDSDAALPSPQVFSAREDAVQDAVRSLGVAELRATLTPHEAARRAHRLRGLKARLDYSPAVILRAPRGQKIEGREIWDVMLCLGLKWGDMDIFHWENPGGLGDEYFFSVWTSTPPGYFFPEEVAAGKVGVEDLVFGFSVPRCSKPGQVFESMVRAVEYARKRLGGSITDETGSEAALDSIRQKIRSIEHEMKSNGFAPGGDSALRLF